MFDIHEIKHAAVPLSGKSSRYICRQYLSIPRHGHRGRSRQRVKAVRGGGARPRRGPRPLPPGAPLRLSRRPAAGGGGGRRQRAPGGAGARAAEARAVGQVLVHGEAAAARTGNTWKRRSKHFIVPNFVLCQVPVHVLSHTLPPVCTTYSLSELPSPSMYK